MAARPDSVCLQSAELNQDRSIKAKYSSDAEHPVLQPENNAEYIARLLTIWVSSLLGYSLKGQAAAAALFSPG